jgi:hypothetical protein
MSLHGLSLIALQQMDYSFFLLLFGIAAACTLLFLGGRYWETRATRATLQKLSFAEEVRNKAAQGSAAVSALDNRRRKNDSLLYATLVSREFFEPTVRNMRRGK